MSKPLTKSSKNSNLLQTILKYLVAATLLGVPLYPKFPFLRVPGTYVSIRLEDFLIFLTVLVWFLYILPKLKQLLSDPLAQAVILFLIVGLVSVISAILITKTVVPHIALLHWARRVEYLLCFFIGISAVRKKEDFAFYIKCLGIVVLYAFVYGLAQRYFRLPVVTTQNLEYSKGVALRFMPGGHMISTFAGHYDLASFLVLVLPLFILLLLSKFSELKAYFGSSSLAFRLGTFAVSTSAFWLLLNTINRISIFAYGISITLGLFLNRKIKYIPLVLIISFIFIATSTSLIDRYTRVFEVYFQKVLGISEERSYMFVPEAIAIESIPTPAPSVIPTITPAPVPVFEDRSTSIRLNVEWPRALRAFLKNPLLGTGYSSITLATDNDYLRLLGEAGLLGFAAFGLIFVRLARLYLKNLKFMREGSFAGTATAGIAVATIGVLINAVFIDVFEASKFAILFWLITGFAVALIRINRNEKNY